MTGDSTLKIGINERRLQVFIRAGPAVSKAREKFQPRWSVAQTNGSAAALEKCAQFVRAVAKGCWSTVVGGKELTGRTEKGG